MNKIVDGKKEGYWEVWLDDDLIDFKGCFRNDKEEGDFEYSLKIVTDEQETYLIRKGQCKNGKELGLWKTYKHGKLLLNQYII